MALPERIEAMSYNCGLCDGAERAVLLITPLSGADTMAVGQQCAALAYISLLASTLDIDTDKLYEHIMSLTSDEGTGPEQVTLPTGYVYGPNGTDVLSEDDVDAGLCGLIHDDWWHCHRKAKHAGKHGRAEAFPGEAAQPPPVDVPPISGAGSEAQ